MLRYGSNHHTAETVLKFLPALIAAHALALDAILVTDNLWEFSRVPGLRVENWLGEP